MYIFLSLLYLLIPAIALSLALKQLRATRQDPEKHQIATQTDGLLTTVILFAILPLLSVPTVRDSLIPHGLFSLNAAIITVLAIALTLPAAQRTKRFFFYEGGVTAAIFEEILFRGAIFGLLLQVIDNHWYVLVINSLLFGLWHLKNIPWSGSKRAVPQAIYTGVVAGPIFSFFRILTGDIYLAVLAHLLHNLILMFIIKRK